MSVEQVLKDRSNEKCELCSSNDSSSVYLVEPSDNTADQSILVCKTCSRQLNDDAKIDANHWRCLSDSMWSLVPAVQVVAYRQLKKLESEGWSSNLLEMLYLEPDVQAWADAVVDNDDGDLVPGKDSNGATLNAGDKVTIIKDLDVKGTGFTAKRGTMVKNISLTTSPDAIEGRVNGVRIVLKTCFLKKA